MEGHAQGMEQGCCGHGVGVSVPHRWVCMAWVCIYKVWGEYAQHECSPNVGECTGCRMIVRGRNECAWCRVSVDRTWVSVHAVVEHPLARVRDKE